MSPSGDQRIVIDYHPVNLGIAMGRRWAAVPSSTRVFPLMTAGSAVGDMINSLPYESE
jgi:hypothetical protein